jgi:hypothetical protein
VPGDEHHQGLDPHSRGTLPSTPDTLSLTLSLCLSLSLSLRLTV